jgi:tRNA A-37 threonylcarbamoyl transferase component Bud32
LTPVAVVEGVEKTLFFKGRDFLITQAVPGERTYQYFAVHFRTPLSYETVADKRALIDAAGREIGRLHRAGIFHGDLRVGNIIIDGRSSTARFFFIDNERTQFYREIPEKKRLKNLVQLNMVLLPQITRTDRLRFLRGYLSVNPELVSRRKETVRKVRVLTEKRVREKFSRGPLS